jgi:hypothetical protein
LRSASGALIQWSVFGLAVAVAGLFWAADAQAFLMSLGADRIIWFPVAVLWVEIGVIVAALIRRHATGRPAVGGGSTALALAAAAVNFTFLVMVGLADPLG